MDVNNFNAQYFRNKNKELKKWKARGHRAYKVKLMFYNMRENDSGFGRVLDFKTKAVLDEGYEDEQRLLRYKDIK